MSRVIASEVLDAMDRLQRDAVRRAAPASSWDLFRACMADGLLQDHEMDALAGCLQELLGDGLIAYETQSGGTALPTRWDGVAIQQLHGWRVTAAGRADAKL